MSNQEFNYYLLVEKIVKSCVNKDYKSFAHLFSEDAQIILKNQLVIENSQIESVTKEYFSTLKYININVNSLQVSENIIKIDWLWMDFDKVKNKMNKHHNHIIIEVKNNLIYRWRELEFNQVKLGLI